MKISYKSIISVLLFTLTTVFFYGQNVVSSPYSSFGIGNISPIEHPIHSAMGGVGYTLQRNNFVNMNNPAALSGVDSMSFIFDLGLYVCRNTLSSSQAQSRSFSGNLGYLALAFPVFPWWQTGLSLDPMTDVSYRIKEHGDTSIFPYAHYNIYEGNGGLNRLTWLNAFSPVRNLSLGIGMEYIFGNYFRSSTIHITDTGNFFNSGLEDNIHVNAFNFRLGAQYFLHIKNDYRFGLGAVYEAGLSLPTDEVYYSYTFSEANGIITLRDSISRQEIKGKHIKLPSIMGFGISLEKPNRWFLGLDATYTAWSKFEFQNKPVSEMKNNVQIRLGCEIRPDAYGNYLSKITYRLGMFYDSGYLQLSGHNINEYGITAGLGLPIRRSESSMNLFFRYALKGTHKDNLLKENTYTIGISVSSKDRWFFTRKYQ